MTALDHMLKKSKFSLHNGRHPHMASGSSAACRDVVSMTVRLGRHRSEARPNAHRS